MAKFMPQAFSSHIRYSDFCFASITLIIVPGVFSKNIHIRQTRIIRVSIFFYYFYISYNQYFIYLLLDISVFFYI